MSEICDRNETMNTQPSPSRASPRLLNRPISAKKSLRNKSDKEKKQQKQRFRSKSMESSTVAPSSTATSSEEINDHDQANEFNHDHECNKNRILQKAKSIDVANFTAAGNDHLVIQHSMSQGSSSESIASDLSSGTSSSTHLHLGYRARSKSDTSSKSSTDEPLNLSPLNSPKFQTRNRRHSMAVNSWNWLPSLDIPEKNRQSKLTRPQSAHTGKNNTIELKNDDQNVGTDKERRKSKPFNEWLAEKDVYERIKQEQQRRIELEKESQIAKYMNERLSHGTSFDKWLEEKRKTRKISVNNKINEPGNHEKTKEELRKIEAAKKYEEWLELKFKQEMETEERLLRQRSKTKRGKDKRKI